MAWLSAGGESSTNCVVLRSLLDKRLSGTTFPGAVEPECFRNIQPSPKEAMHSLTEASFSVSRMPPL